MMLFHSDVPFGIFTHNMQLLSTKPRFKKNLTTNRRRSSILGRLRFHDDNENDNEISLSFSLRFCTQRDERLIASISSSTTKNTNRNQGRTQEMMMSAHKNFVLVLVIVVVAKWSYDCDLS